MWRIRIYTLGPTNVVVQWVKDEATQTTWSFGNQGHTAIANSSMSAMWLQNNDLRWYYQPNETSIHEVIWGETLGWLEGATFSTNVEGPVQST